MQRLYLLLVFLIFLQINCYGQTPISANSELIAAARSASVNFMADSTEMPPSSPLTIESPKPLEKQLSFERVLSSSAGSQRFAWLQVSDKTFLVWTQPDVQDMARKILAGETVRILRTAPNDAKASNDSTHPLTPTQEQLELINQGIEKQNAAVELGSNLTALFQEKYGWDPATPGSKKEVRVRDLPPAMRAKVVAQIQADVARPEILSIWKSWFSDEFWKAATLRVVSQPTGPQPGQAVSILTVGGMSSFQGGRGSSMLSLGALK